MTAGTIQFNDGAAYERYMGVWSGLVAAEFLAWLAPKPGLRWLDVGCGNGAFTEALAGRCAPAALSGVDPSEAQLAYARSRPALARAELVRGDAMSLPFKDRSFDAAVMPLVVSFVPEPARGLAEMRRVVGPGGLLGAYMWDMLGGGFPYAPLRSELKALGADVPAPPSPDASTLESLRALWTGGGLVSVETRTIEVRRTFGSFSELWSVLFGGPSVGPLLAAMEAPKLETLQARLRARFPADGSGRVTCGARANAVKGLAP